MTKTRIDSAYIECTYMDLPRSYMKLKHAGFDIEDIIKRRIGTRTYILTAIKRERSER